MCSEGHRQLPAVPLLVGFTAPEHGCTDALVLGPLTVAVAAMAVFAVWERRTPRPMLDTFLFTERRFIGAALGGPLAARRSTSPGPSRWAWWWPRSPRRAAGRRRCATPGTFRRCRTDA
jgi:hypothetical protein